MKEKDRTQKRIEIEHEAIPEIDHETHHPDREETKLKQTSFEPGKDYLNMDTGVQDER
ncbi:hypothetical protein GI584_08165 [Gracilibacillus salitolerans]|uniref:Uncharacterized protein n=1 Tax=Gracilibacillus salitolerans TaxID=2663022 RepID=A0A5Q2TGP4_9BACI|nr:hypothetical protein [Gracilibacillus salitolerans]QGH33999.1 hypothetical protein GI584_08165 [Gracilibacillus salitolerans]